MPDEHGRMDPLEAADQAMHEHNPERYPSRTTNAIIQAIMQPPLFTKAVHDQLVNDGCKVDMIGADLAVVEVRSAAKLMELADKMLGDNTPYLARIRMNRAHYTSLKALTFVQLYSVGTKREPDPPKYMGFPLQGVQITVDDTLKEVEYYDQFGNRMYPEQPRSH